MSQLSAKYYTRQHNCAWIIHMRTVKRYVALNIIGGCAFFVLGKILFQSAILCLICNVAATQMLHYVLPAQ